jgi:hypothetical protein
MVCSDALMTFRKGPQGELVINLLFLKWLNRKECFILKKKAPATTGARSLKSLQEEEVNPQNK